MTSAIFRISSVPGPAQPVRDKLSHGAGIERGDVVIKSPLDTEASVNDHLVWLWGALKHERRFLKRLQSEGAKLRCTCSASKGAVHIQPNGAEMLHLLGAELVIEVR